MAACFCFAEMCGPRVNASSICFRVQFGPQSTGQPFSAYEDSSCFALWSSAYFVGHISPNLPIVCFMGISVGISSLFFIARRISFCCCSGVRSSLCEWYGFCTWIFGGIGGSFTLDVSFIIRDDECRSESAVKDGNLSWTGVFSDLTCRKVVVDIFLSDGIQPLIPVLEWWIYF